MMDTSRFDALVETVQGFPPRSGSEAVARRKTRSSSEAVAHKKVLLGEVL